jgi:hypothetical protein
VFASLDLRAQSLYLKFGMRPRGMFYMLKGTPRPAARPRFAVELEPIGAPGTTSREMLAIAARFDRTFRGTRRDPDIRFITTLPGAHFFRARAGRTTLGYAVINPRGRVGPAGVIDPRYSAGLAWAIQRAAREMGAETIVLTVPETTRPATTLQRRPTRCLRRMEPRHRISRATSSPAACCSNSPPPNGVPSV